MFIFRATTIKAPSSVRPLLNTSRRPGRPTAWFTRSPSPWWRHRSYVAFAGSGRSKASRAVYSFWRERIVCAGDNLGELCRLGDIALSELLPAFYTRPIVKPHQQATMRLYTAHSSRTFQSAVASLVRAVEERDPSLAGH